MADDVKQVPEYIECGESGSGALEDTPDGNRSRRLTLKYVISNITGYDSAEARMEKLAPRRHKGMRRGKIQCDPVGGGFYLATVEYANESIIRRDTFNGQGFEEFKATGLAFSGWEWETSEKSERVTQAFTSPFAPANEGTKGYSQETGSGGAAPGTEGLPNFFGAIGVEGDQVRGVEKPMALFNWSETWIFPASYITEKRPDREAFVRVGADPKVKVQIPQEPLQDIAADYTFSTNKETFRGKPPGCVLLTGIRSGRMNLGSSTASLTFSFSYAPERNNFLVGPVSVENKAGWDYLDIYYQTSADTEELIKVAKWVFVHQIFDRKDFRNLGIPTDKMPAWWLPEEMPGHVFDTPFGK